jgi:hypothetical protein
MTEERMRASIEAWVAAWNEHDPAKRRALIERACSTEIRFVTRGPELVGHEKLAALMGEFQGRQPHARAALSSVVEIQHRAFRYAGKVEGMVPTPPEALEVGECDDDGRIRFILSFVGASPPR